MLIMVVGSRRRRHGRRWRLLRRLRRRRRRRDCAPSPTIAPSATAVPTATAAPSATAVPTATRGPVITVVPVSASGCPLTPLVRDDAPRDANSDPVRGAYWHRTPTRPSGPARRWRDTDLWAATSRMGAAARGHPDGQRAPDGRGDGTAQDVHPLLLPHRLSDRGPGVPDQRLLGGRCQGGRGRAALRDGGRNRFVVKYVERT